jgi:hypothetical protein
MPSTLFNITNIIHLTTSVSRRLNISCIMFKIIPFFIITLVARLHVKVGILHVKSTCMTASFHREGRFGSIKLANSTTCVKSGKWVIRYLFVRGIDLIFYFWTVPTVVFFFHFINTFYRNLHHYFYKYFHQHCLIMYFENEP